MINLIKALKVILVVCLLIIFSCEIAAQQLHNQHIRLKQEVVNDVSVTSPKNGYKKSVLADMLMPNFSLGGIEFPVPERNFLPSLFSLKSAGDVNGDGIADLFYVITAGDETTDQLEDLISKTEVFQGSSAGLDKNNSKLISEEFFYVTDLNGDGTTDGFRTDDDNKVFVVVDESDGELSQIVEQEVFESDFFITTIESYGDINGDGFSDALAYSFTPDRSADADLIIVYGAGSIENVQLDTLTYTPEGTSGVDRFLYADLDGNGMVELVRVSSVSGASHSGFITIYQTDETGSFQQVSQQSLSTNVFENGFSLSAGRVGLTDLNQNGSQELIIMADSELQIFILSETEGEFYTEENTVPEVFQATGFSIIGDYNDDGFSDLLLLNDTDLKVVFGNSNLNLAEENLPLAEDEMPVMMNSRGKYLNSARDINGDSIDDIVIAINRGDSEEIIYRAYHGNSSASFDIMSEINFPVNDETDNPPRYSVNTGDINGDATEDFAIVYNKAVGIYFGESTFSDPDIIIEAPDTAFFSSGSPVSGDFNGDGFSDIVVTMNDFSSSQSRQGLYFYFGGPSADNIFDHQLLMSELFPELEGEDFYEQGFPAISNIGDINNDGVEDLTFSHSVAPYVESYILLGGNTLSNSPDITLAHHGTNFVNTGDMNGDCFNNFVVGSFLQDSETVFVYSGFDEASGESFSDEPILTIPNPNSQAIGFFSFIMEAGDFDGDGFKDLVISPLFHFDVDGNGIDAFYFYRGGTEADSLADHSFPLKNSFVANVLNELGDINATSSIGELTVVPDINGDGTDELLFGTTPGNFGEDGLTNAVIYFGNINLTETGTEPDLVLEAPNQLIGLGSRNNNILSQTAHSAVGDFNADGQTDILLPQPSDFNFLRSKSYFFELPVSVSNEEEEQIVTSFSLDQNYPNPFNPSTEISYSLPQTGMVTLQVYDITGRLISTLVNKNQVAGNHQVRFDAQNLSSGMYIYRLQSGSFTQTRKMILIK